MKATIAALLGVFAPMALADPTVYLIRHGEKPDEGNGLSEKGEQRAQCLRSIFGSASPYDIDYIIAQTPQDSKATAISYLSEHPLTVLAAINRWEATASLPYCSPSGW
jgi:broad specificity phosphatase PhoE